MRIFISHSSKNTNQARAVKKWLIEAEPSLEDEIFLDAADLLPGAQWKPALQAANRRCEAVICLLSTDWEQSPECQLEFRYGETLNKDILCARLESTASAKTRAWQHCDLFVRSAEAQSIPIKLDDGSEVAFATEGLEKLRRGLIELGVVRDYFRWPPPKDPDRSPYRGWADLDIYDAAVFFGRDAEIVSAMDALKGMHKTGVTSMLVIQGSSGVGKSAFLRAGLLPRIQKDSRFLLMDVVRPEHDVLAGPNGLAKSIFNLRESLGLREPKLLAIEKGCQAGDIKQIVEWVDEARLAAPTWGGDTRPPAAPTIVLPLDQAEELFGTSRRESDAVDMTERFLQILAKLLPRHDGTAPAVMMLATVRADSYELLQNSPALAGVGSVSFNELTPMHPTLFREVIKGPAARHTKDVEPLELEAELVDRLVEDCPDADALPLLALTLDHLIIRYGKTGTRTVDEYDELGGVDSIVDTLVDEVVGKGAGPERDVNLSILRRAFIPAMASINIYDQPQRRLADWDGLPRESHDLLTRLADKNVLTKTEQTGGTVVEVAIESLLRRWKALSRWLTDESIYLKAAERVELSALDWDKHQRKSDHLAHRGERLRDAEKLAAQGRYFTNRDVPTADYLAACSRRRRRRLIAKWLSYATAAALIFAGGVAVKGYRQSHMHFREATAERLTSEAQAMLSGGGPDGDYRAIQQLIAAPLVTNSEKLGWRDRLMTDPMSASPAVSGALLDAVNGRRDLRKIVPTNAMITSVAFSRDGSTMATGNVDGQIQLWDTKTAAPRGDTVPRDDKWHTSHGVVWSVAYAGDTLVSAANDGTVEKWDSAGNPTPLAKSKIDTPTRSIVAAPDGTVVAGSADGKVRIWNVGHEEKGVQEIVVGGGAVESVALHGNVIATGSTDGTVHRWNLLDPKHEELGSQFKFAGTVWCVAFSPDGRRLAVAGRSPEVWIQNLDVDRHVSLPHPGGVWTVAFDPAGSGRVVTGGIDDTIKVWDAGSQQKIGDLVTGDGGDVKAVAFADGGLVSVGDDKTLRLWSIPSPPPPRRVAEDPVVGLRLEPNRIVTTTASGVARQWNTDGTPVDAPIVRMPVANNIPPAIDSAGAVVAVMTTRSGGEIWTAEGLKTDDKVTLPAELADAPPPVATTDTVIAVGGNRLAAISRSPDIVRFWDIRSGKEVGHRVDQLGDRKIRAIRLSADGRRLATADTDGNIDVWDTDTGTRMPQPKPMAGDADYDKNARHVTLAFSDDNSRLVSGAVGDDQLRVWDVASGTQLGESMSGHQRDVTAVAFSHDGRFIISGALDGTVRIWDAIHQRPAGQALAIKQPREIPDPDHLPLFPTAVAMSPDGNRIVAGLNDGSVRTWPGPETWEKLLCAKVNDPLTEKQWQEWVGSKVKQFGTCR
ncbi:TIR domain-containing protein [Mycobacterium sp. PDNC021]|uniref:nSTAND1 domain-containing NTPase n=1 Tax=Mycobacterium sp. PDNC021 TaxID=3391399 RepID=UPI003AAAC332